LIDFDQLALIPKAVRPIEEQEPNESRRLWDPVTKNLLAKNWGEATKQKQLIEQVGAVCKVHDLADECSVNEISRLRRKRTGMSEYGRSRSTMLTGSHQSAFFEPDYSDGRPKLSAAGIKAVEDEVARSKRGQ
jgi:hypothetical protein